MPRLSRRLLALACFVTKGNSLADIGTDHAWLPIYLVKEGICEKVIATDIRPGPLQRAKEHIRNAHLEANEGSTYDIETRLSDGLHAIYPWEAESIVIAGMGGATMAKILMEGEGVARQAKELILQPQSEIWEFRRFLDESRYRITHEDMVYEDGKFYPMMRAVPADVDPEASCHCECTTSMYAGAIQLSKELAWKYGPKLLEMRHPVLLDYCLWRKQLLENILARLSEHASKEVTRREAELLQEIREVDQVIKIME